ncbi:MAG: DUF559 domain-containing protein [Sporichthyaceae bacterium]
MREITAETIRRRRRRARVAELATHTGGVLDRRTLYRLGITRWELAAELRAQRWSAPGRQTVRVAAGDPQLARWNRALYEVGKSAVLDGVSALQASGLRHFDEAAVHVAVPKSANPRRCRDVVVHETRRYDRETILTDGIARTRPATAAVHAVLWARSDRQAATIVLMAGQQRLFTLAEFCDEVEKIRRDARRGLLRALRSELAGGIEAIGERDFARMCAKRGLPQPTRQVSRRTAGGRWIFDNVWEPYALIAEIDGSQHLEPTSWIGDALKQNVASLNGHTVLRIPNIALRLDPEPFLDQLEQALRDRGWPGPNRAA